HHRPAVPRPVQPPPPASRPSPPGPPSPPPVVTAIGTGPNERAADLAAHILPLGTGFALMGLGLGYLGMRLRKGL
ncbi:molybdopterin-dependent oxidoreductase, partial [Streptomyces sp. NPDC055796]